jgi:pimeloyl-ACP methyl ester carboxylesterase
MKSMSSSSWRPLSERDPRYRVLDVPARGYPLRIIEPVRPATQDGAIVMVHGMEESWDVWEQVVPRLETRARVLRLDMPWSGALGYDWTTERETIAGWLKRALDAVPAPIIGLVGHSFGAMAALEYLDVYGVRDLRAVALVSPLHLGRDQELDWPRIEHLSSHYLRFLGIALAVRQRRERIDAELGAIMAEKVRDKIGPVGCLEFLRLLSRSKRIDLGGLGIPFLVLGGEDDFYSLPADCERLATELPRGRACILPSCGHFSMIEQPDRVAALLEGLFESHATGSINKRTRDPEEIRS